MTTSSLYPTHIIICKAPQLSSEFQTQSQSQRPGRFSNDPQRRAPIGRWVKKIINEYHFEHGEAINYIHAVTTKIQVAFLTHLLEKKEPILGCHHEAIGVFLKHLRCLMAVIGKH